uniref:CREB-regulated transcription coactivator 3 n=1 Tax=Apis cerana TaxID=7461 RepID=V9I8L5_APICE
MANPRKFSDKIALHKQKEAQERAAFEAIMREVSDYTSRDPPYRNNERGRSMGVGPMRSRPMEKRHDTSPYSGVPYLSPPPPDTWRRTNSDSALHQSANEACQSTTTIPHRRDQHAISGSGSENRNLHYGFIERPRSSCEIPRVPGNNIDPSSQPAGQQIPIGNTRSLPDLAHFQSDQEDHSSSTPFSNNHLSVPVNSRFLHTCKGVALENSTSTSQQDLQSYSQQPPMAQPPTATTHSPAGHHYIYQQPHSPVPPQSPKSSQTQQPQLNSLGSYRSSQQVNRPSPQSSPGLTIQGSPLSYSNNPSAPPSPTGHPGPPNLTSESIDQNSYFMNQAQAAALQQDFEQFTMMDTPVPTNMIGTYIGRTNTTSYAQNDTMNVGGELGSGDAGYFSTSPQVPYQPATTTATSNTRPPPNNSPHRRPTPRRSS